MFEVQLDEAGIFRRAWCSIDWSVSFRECDYLREIADERKEFAESPDTATLEIRIDGSSVSKDVLRLSRSSDEIEGILNLQQIAASRAGIDPLINEITFCTCWFDTAKTSL